MDEKENKHLANVYSRFRNYDHEYGLATSDIIFPPEIYEEIKKYMKGTILDIGTGDGFKLENLLKRCNNRNIDRIIAIDPSPLYKIAKERLDKYPNIEVRYCSLEDFESQILYDTILLFDVVEHVTNCSQIMKKILNLLIPNGSLIISTPNRPVYDFTEKLFKGKIDSTHVNEMNFVEFSQFIFTYFRKVKFKGILPIMKIGRKFPFFLKMHKFISYPYFFNNIICFARLPIKSTT